MDFRVIWTRTALADLRDLVRYIARDDKQVAERFGNSIVSKTRGLSKFPRLGRITPEYGSDSIRQVLVPPYRIVYKVDDETCEVAVIRIWHGARGNLGETDKNP